MKYIMKLKEAFSTQLSFRISDVQRLFPKASKGYLKLLLHNLVSKGRVFRISKGTYSFCGDIVSIGLAFSPYYYGLQEALSIHGLWQQETNPIVITPRSVRCGIRHFGNSNYVVRRISRRMFFGYSSVKYSGLWVNVSDVEKTLIDMVYFRLHISDELAVEFLKRIGRGKLKGYISRSPKWVGEKLNDILQKY